MKKLVKKSGVICYFFGEKEFIINYEILDCMKVCNDDIFYFVVVGYRIIDKLDGVRLLWLLFKN